MASTHPSAVQPAAKDESTPTVLRWRTWPLVDHPRTSWLTLAGILTVGGVVGYLAESWLAAVAAAAGLGGTLWQYFVPVRYEIGPLGVRRSAVGRARLIPWHAVRAYQMRSTGVLLYQSADPAKIDVLRSMFLPYPADEDGAVCALRQQLSHAAELPP